MRPSTAWALGISALGSIAAAFFGARTWLRENAYASSHPYSQLTDVLQALAVGELAIGIAGLAATFWLYQHSSDD